MTGQGDKDACVQQCLFTAVLFIIVKISNHLIFFGGGISP